MESSLVSVVIVAGPKRVRELIRCLRSIKRSTYKNYEVIVVDNSQNPHLVKKVKAKFPTVRLIVMPDNTGILGFNIGFANARGKYILALDDDCTIRPDTLENIAKIFPKKPKKVAVLSTNIYEVPSKRFIYQNYLKENITNLYIAANMAVFRREIFTKVGYYDSNFFLWVHEDDLSIRILDAGCQIHFEPQIVVDHYLTSKARRGVRPHLLFYWPRNLAWFNIKHFSVYFWPLLILRNLVSLFLAPLKRRSLLVLPYVLVGYLAGWLTFYIPFKKRKVVNPKLEKKFLKFYLFDKF